MSSRRLGILFGVLAFGMTAGAMETANLSVTATVLDSCSVSTTALDFGTLTQSATNTEASAGTIVVTCSASKTIDVTLDAGANDDGSTRRMTDGSSFIAYNIYSDSGHSSPVGLNGSIFNSGVTASAPETITVYGQVGAALYSAGSYSDTIVVTVTY